MELISCNFKNMDRKQWRKMKSVAAEKGVTLKEFLTRAIGEAIAKYEKEPFHKEEGEKHAGN